MNRTCHNPDCNADISHLRGDAKFCGGACKQAAWRARESTRRRARIAATRAAVADRDLVALLEQSAAAARGGTAFLKAGAQLRTITAAELLLLAELARAARVQDKP